MVPTRTAFKTSNIQSEIWFETRFCRCNNKPSSVASWTVLQPTAHSINLKIDSCQIVTAIAAFSGRCRHYFSNVSTTPHRRVFWLVPLQSRLNGAHFDNTFHNTDTILTIDNNNCKKNLPTRYSEVIIHNSRLHHLSSLENWTALKTVDLQLIQWRRKIVKRNCQLWSMTLIKKKKMLMQFDLTCDNEWKVTLASSVYMIGMFVGGLGWGNIADT